MSNLATLQDHANQAIAAEGKVKPAFATIEGFCELSSMSRSAVYVEMGRGNIKAIKVGKRTLIEIEPALAWLRSLPAANIRPPKAA